MTDANTANGSVTVVLVHGAFADGSSWSGVIERLQAAGIPVRAAVNPLRGIAADSAYVASVFSQIPGPVMAVGHSYVARSLPTPPRTRAMSSAWSTWPRLPPMRARRWGASKLVPRTAS